MSHLYHARERRRERADPAYHLSRSVRVLVGDSPFTAGRPSGFEDRPITFACRVRVDTLASCAGVIFEMGTSVANVGLALANTGDLEVVAGAAGGATITGAFGADGHTRDIVVSVNPGTGDLRVWLDGEDSLRDNSDMDAAGFSSDAIISLEALNGTTRLSNNGALTDAILIGGLSVYYEQLPRHFTA